MFDRFLRWPDLFKSWGGIHGLRTTSGLSSGEPRPCWVLSQSSKWWVVLFQIEGPLESPFGLNKFFLCQSFGILLFSTCGQVDFDMPGMERLGDPLQQSMQSGHVRHGLIDLFVIMFSFKHRSGIILCHLTYYIFVSFATVYHFMLPTIAFSVAEMAFCSHKGHWPFEQPAPFRPRGLGRHACNEWRIQELAAVNETLQRSAPGISPPAQISRMLWDRLMLWCCLTWSNIELDVFVTIRPPQIRSHDSFWSRLHNMLS